MEPSGCSFSTTKLPKPSDSPAAWSIRRLYDCTQIQLMKTIRVALILLCASVPGTAGLRAQQPLPLGEASNSGAQSPSSQAQPPAQPSSQPPAQSAPPRETAQSYSGTYTFLKDGEFVQVTVEDDSRVTGFISRFGDSESDKDQFLDQFFKTGKVDGNKLTFTTQIVHGTFFDFKGSVERGEGKEPGDEAYYVLKGALTTSTTDANKKVTAQSQEVAFKLFPKDAAPAR